MENKKTCLALVLGLVALLLCWTIYLAVISLALSIVGFIVAIKVHKTIKLSGHKTLLIKTAIVLNAIAGLVSGIIIIEFIIYHLIKLFVSSIG